MTLSISEVTLQVFISLSQFLLTSRSKRLCIKQFTFKMDEILVEMAKHFGELESHPMPADTNTFLASMQLFAQMTIQGMPPPKNSKLSEQTRIVGNKFFKKENFRGALISYITSLCFALPGSQQIPLVYGNRSAVYCEMGKYALALENIELARENGFPLEKMAHLDAREEKCKKLMQKFGPDNSFDNSSFFKLSHQPNKKIPFIADCLELRQNEKYGRHIVTTKNLKTGDIIAIAPSVFSWTDRFVPTASCFVCTKTKKGSLIPCLLCTTGYSR